MDGEMMSESSTTDSPVLEKRALDTEEGARVAHFTTVSPEVLLAIFAESEDEPPEIVVRDVAIDKEIDHFLGINKDTLAFSNEVASTPQRREAAALSRYADGKAGGANVEDQFDTTRRRKNASYPSGALDLMALFPAPVAAKEATASDEVHATVKPGSSHAQNVSSASSAADDEFEISPNGSIRRKNPPQSEIAEQGEVVDAGREVNDEDEDESEQAQVATVVLSPSTAVAAEAVESQQYPSIRDIFGPMTSIPAAQAEEDAPATAVDVASSEETVDEEPAATEDTEAASVDRVEGGEGAESEAADAVSSYTKTAIQTIEEEDENIMIGDERPSEATPATTPTIDEPETEEATHTDAMTSTDQNVAAETEVEAEVEDDAPPSSVPSMTASKLPTPTLHAKRDASLEFGDVSGLDLDVADLDPIEPGGEKLAVPLTMLAPAPDGKGSIKKRSMVLVDRRRFESLARRMGVLEEQLAGLEGDTSAASSMAGSQARASNLRGL
ncbi:hypothetical protein CF327_g7797, partial [Tilletia walkeri]